MFSSTDTLGGYFNSGVVKLKWGYICFVRDTYLEFGNEHFV